MLRVLLTLLIGQQLLMPAGMCICQFAPCGRASADEIGQSVFGEADAPSLGLDLVGCSQCRQQFEQTNQETSESLPAKYSGPVPLSDQHMPSCPAVCISAIERLTLPTFQNQTLFVHSLDLVVFTAIHVKMSVSGVHLLGHFHSTPIFIIHCTLLV